MTTIVHVADVICCCCNIGFDLTARMDTLDRSSLEIVPPELLEEATAQAPEWAQPAIDVLS